ncbi:tyrosine-type recombinase/integrase [Micromonospora arborensis]|uniref:tyrosine-type recombinase/integrase n=1 Tax=Micromonospora arborensis TaxID=2116518 RepID=UPI001FC9E6C7|nr:tyrosine-type recombinase/integrase [Micromonospora arborensis]
MNVRLPAWRVPGWLLVFWWLGRGLFRLAVLAARYWWITAPAGLALWVRVEFGGLVLAGVVAAVAAGCVVWWRWHPLSWLRFGWYPLVARVRALVVYRPRWASVMATCGLATVFGGDRYVPRLLRVRCDRYGDELTVRMLPGQIPDDWGQAAERLAYAFRLPTGQARSTDRPDRVVVRLMRRDPLAGIVAPLPVGDVPELDGLPLGVQEDGQAYRLRLTGSHVLIAGVPAEHRGIVCAAAGAGLRWGECAGLPWEAVDLDRGLLYVAQVAVETHGGIVLRAYPKSRAGVRAVPMPPFLVDELRQRRGAASPDGRALVFADRDGGPQRRSNFRRRIWLPSLVRAGLLGRVTEGAPGRWLAVWPDRDGREQRAEFPTQAAAVAHAAASAVGGLRFHDLRHSYITWLVTDGVPVNVVQRVVGHEKASTTLDRYTHTPEDYADRVRLTFADNSLTFRPSPRPTDPEDTPSPGRERSPQRDDPRRGETGVVEGSAPGGSSRTTQRPRGVQPLRVCLFRGCEGSSYGQVCLSGPVTSSGADSTHCENLLAECDRDHTERSWWCQPAGPRGGLTPGTRRR